MEMNRSQPSAAARAISSDRAGMGSPNQTRPAGRGCHKRRSVAATGRAAARPAPAPRKPGSGCRTGCRETRPGSGSLRGGAVRPRSASPPRGPGASIPVPRGPGARGWGGLVPRGHAATRTTPRRFPDRPRRHRPLPVPPAGIGTTARSVLRGKWVRRSRRTRRRQSAPPPCATTPGVRRGPAEWKPGSRRHDTRPPDRAGAVVGGPRPRTAAGVVLQAAWDGAARLRSTYCRIPP